MRRFSPLKLALSSLTLFSRLSSLCNMSYVKLAFFFNGLPPVVGSDCHHHQHLPLLSCRKSSLLGTPPFPWLIPWTSIAEVSTASSLLFVLSFGLGVP